MFGVFRRIKIIIGFVEYVFPCEYKLNMLHEYKLTINHEINISISKQITT